MHGWTRQRVTGVDLVGAGASETLGFHLVARVANRRKKASALDAAIGCVRTFERKRIASDMSGRRGLRVRDREAPGSNPGPPTSFRTQTQPVSGAKVIPGLCHYSISTALWLRCQ